MLSRGEEPAVVTKYIRRLRGGSQPILAKAGDGSLYVVKFRNNVQGPNLLFNECMGTELFRLAGLSVPSWRVLIVTDEFAERNPATWIETPYGLAPPESGQCFGSRFLGGDDARLFEILPGNSFRRVRNRIDFWLAWLLDVCAGNADNRQVIFRQDSEGGLEAVFVDHGHMFSSPRGNLKPHFTSSRYYLDPRIYPNVSSEVVEGLRKRVLGLDLDRLWAQVLSLPDEWITQSALNNFTNCLETLSNTRSIERVIDVITRSQFPTCVFGRDDDFTRRREPGGSLLRPGVQAARVEWSICA